MFEAIQSQLNRAGYKIAIVPVDHLDDLRQSVDGLREGGELDGNIYDLASRYYRFELPEASPPVQSIIILAAPSPQVKVYFHWKGERRGLMIPPTYVDCGERDKTIEREIREIFGRYGHIIVKARLPKKLSAVRSGLGSYGRNNICYIPGMGSFVYLAAFYSDLVCKEDPWREAVLMDSCQKCAACLRNCPTGAIASDRVLIKAERCIAYYNEFSEAPDFPGWIPGSAHNCIVGCLHCQACCPQNRDYLNNVVELVEFNEAETGLLLAGKAFHNLPAPLMDKLKRLTLDGYQPMLARNLRALLREI